MNELSEHTTGSPFSHVAGDNWGTDLWSNGCWEGKTLRLFYLTTPTSDENLLHGHLPRPLFCSVTGVFHLVIKLIRNIAKIIPCRTVSHSAPVHDSACRL